MTKQRDDYDALESLLGYHFQDVTLLDTALTHRSFARQNRVDDNERMEFLGDAVLQLVVSSHLYENFPKLQEGQLAKVRALLVSQPTLAELGRQLKLNEFLKVGKGEERTGARERDSLLCDVVEAVYGAIYLDGGLEEARRVILKHLPHWDTSELPLIDAKSTLQEHFQQTTQKTPTYKLAAEVGPDHKKQFVVEVRFENEVLGKGRGPSKKEAAQAAAREALANLDICQE
jgi:ribonuclease-3